MNPRLEVRRNDPSPKCATCSWWAQRDSSSARVAQCTLSQEITLYTLDLSVCTHWDEHVVRHGQIIKPDSAD